MITVSKDQPRFRKYRNGHSYSKHTSVYTIKCRVCDNKFLGSYDKWYCSDACRDESKRRAEKSK